MAAPESRVTHVPCLSRYPLRHTPRRTTHLLRMKTDLPSSRGVTSYSDYQTNEFHRGGPTDGVVSERVSPPKRRWCVVPTYTESGRGRPETPGERRTKRQNSSVYRSGHSTVDGVSLRHVETQCGSECETPRYTHTHTHLPPRHLPLENLTQGAY